MNAIGVESRMRWALPGVMSFCVFWEFLFLLILEAKGQRPSTSISSSQAHPTLPTHATPHSSTCFPNPSSPPSSKSNSPISPNPSTLSTPTNGDLHTLLYDHLLHFPKLTRLSTPSLSSPGTSTSWPRTLSLECLPRSPISTT